MRRKCTPILENFVCGKLLFVISVVSVVGLVTNTADAVLVAHYDFEGNAEDSAGSNHGSLMGDATFGTGPTYGGVDFGQALSLDGNGDYVSLPTAFASVTGSATKSIMAWVKSDTIAYPSAEDGGGRIITLYKNSGPASGFSIFPQDTPAIWGSLYTKSADTYEWLDSGVFVIASEWTHVALVQDGANVHIYINGVLENSASDADTPIISNPANADIGAYDGGGYNKGFFNGLIDDVRIYDHAMSQSEIQAVMPEPATLLLLGLGGLILRRRT